MPLTETDIYESSGSFIVKKKPNPISKYIIKRSVILETKTRLLESGVYFEKGFILLAGTLSEDVAMVDRMICPQVATTPVSAKLTEKGVQQIFDAVKKPTEYLFIQIHGHSGRVFDSNIDHGELITFEPGFISVGVPNYGMNLDKLVNCELFEFTGSEWVRLSNADVAKRFEIT